MDCREGITVLPSFPKTLVSIVNWNGYQNTIACLQSLSQLNYPSLRTVIVDNASQDGSPEKIAEVFPHVEIIRATTNLGFAGGHSLAVEKAQMDSTIDLLWLLNNDTLVNENTLISLIDAYRVYGNNLYGSIPLTYSDGTRIEALHGYRLDENLQPDHSKGLDKLVGQRYEEVFRDTEPFFATDIHGSSFLVPMDVIRRYGFMDLTFFVYAEETDYCYRLRYQGIRCVLVPNSTIRHIHGASLSRNEMLSLVSTYYATRNHLLFLRRHERFSSFLSGTIHSGILPLVKDLLYTVDLQNTRRIKAAMSNAFYRALGIYHAIIGRTGKTIAPEDFLG
jgi:GT2 family glycosyltransferase